MKRQRSHDRSRDPRPHQRSHHRSPSHGSRGRRRSAPPPTAPAGGGGSAAAHAVAFRHGNWDPFHDWRPWDVGFSRRLQPFEAAVFSAPRALVSVLSDHPAVARALRSRACDVLDVGCGAGYFVVALAAEFPELRSVMGVDVDAGLVTRARRVAAWGLVPAAPAGGDNDLPAPLRAAFVAAGLDPHAVPASLRRSYAPRRAAAGAAAPASGAAAPLLFFRCEDFVAACPLWGKAGGETRASPRGHGGAGGGGGGGGGSALLPPASAPASPMSPRPRLHLSAPSDADAPSLHQLLAFATEGGALGPLSSLRSGGLRRGSPVGGRGGEGGGAPAPPAPPARAVYAPLPHASCAYGVVTCFGVTKWVHLSRGDAGVVTLLRRAASLLRPGGLLLLRPNAWGGYARAARLLGRHAVPPAAALALRPHQFAEYAVQRCGLALIGEVAPAGRGGSGGGAGGGASSSKSRKLPVYILQRTA